MSYKMTAEHKAKLERGRAEGRVVRAYLRALNTPSTKGRADTIRERIDEIDQKIPTGDPMEDLALLTQRDALEAQLKGSEDNLDELEEEFVKVASSYSLRKNVSYRAWRRVGVPAAVLKRAGIGRQTSVLVDA